MKLAQAKLTDKQRHLADTIMDKFFRVLPQVHIGIVLDIMLEHATNEDYAKF